jgi:nitrile hydratase
MNGAHDMGGMAGFGVVAPETDEPVFHAEWERRAFALTVAMNATGASNIDARRHARELLPPAYYWSHTYYEIWIAGLIAMLSDLGAISEAEIVAGHSQLTPKALPRTLRAGGVSAFVAAGMPFDRAATTAPLFKIGEPVRARNIHPRGHTRLPLYVRGRQGTIARVNGVHVYPDANAHGLGEDPRWLYSVRFSADELWGGDRWGEVRLDLWEPYLEAAT